MIITQIQPVNKTKSKVYIDGQLAFVLYRGELSRYKIRVDAELPEEVYREIVEEVLYKRGRLYCMNLLKTMDRTEQQLREKLRRGHYPETVIEGAIQYVKDYKYIDDERFAKQYIAYRIETKSRQQLTRELMRKGMKKDLISAAFEAAEPADEEKMIRRWLEKKRFDKSAATLKERQKMFQFLMRKGFSGSDISRVLRETDVFDADTFA